MKQFLFASVASVIAVAFMSDAALEVVTVVGEGGEPLRINKSDYDADQAEGGAKQWTLHDDEPLQANGAGAAIGLPGNISMPAAPAAPDFSSGGGTPETIDPNKNAVAPALPSPGQKLVQKNGSGKTAKFVIVVAQGDGTFLPLTNEALNDPAKPNTSPTIEEGGYASDKDAWNAIMSLPT
jgi:hypothetical protein